MKDRLIDQMEREQIDNSEFARKLRLYKDPEVQLENEELTPIIYYSELDDYIAYWSEGET